MGKVCLEDFLANNPDIQCPEILTVNRQVVMAGRKAQQGWVVFYLDNQQ
jgi:hypothetical protein